MTGRTRSTRSNDRARSPRIPHRLGKALDRPFDDVLATRRGDYRVLYTVDDRECVVTVLALTHRRVTMKVYSELPSSATEEALRRLGQSLDG